MFGVLLDLWYNYGLIVRKHTEILGMPFYCTTVLYYVYVCRSYCYSRQMVMEMKLLLPSVFKMKFFFTLMLALWCRSVGHLDILDWTFNLYVFLLGLMTCCWDYVIFEKCTCCSCLKECIFHFMPETFFLLIPPKKCLLLLLIFLWWWWCEEGEGGLFKIKLISFI